MKNRELAPHAFELYLCQMKQKLQFAHEVFHCDPESCQAKEFDIAKLDFHTLRGGAGFFGLNKIAEAAGQIEEILEAEELPLPTKQAQITPLLAGITALAEEIG